MCVRHCAKWTLRENYLVVRTWNLKAISLIAPIVPTRKTNCGTLKGLFKELRCELQWYDPRACALLCCLIVRMVLQKLAEQPHICAGGSSCRALFQSASLRGQSSKQGREAYGKAVSCFWSSHCPGFTQCPALFLSLLMSVWEWNFVFDWKGTQISFWIILVFIMQ